MLFLGLPQAASALCWSQLELADISSQRWDTGSSRLQQEGTAEASSASTAPTALSSLWGEVPHDLLGAKGRDCFM